MYYKRRRFPIYRDNNDILSDATFSLPGDKPEPQKDLTLSDNEDDENDDDAVLIDADSDIDPFAINLASVVKATKRSTPFKNPDVSNPQYQVEKSDTSIEYYSSIHLSEFEQPPRSTSTPNQGLFDTPIMELDLNTTHTPTRKTPFDRRPKVYSTPYFKFNSKSFDPDLSDHLLHDTNRSIFEDSSLSSSIKSPLAYKAKQDDFKNDMNSIMEKMKTSKLIKDYSNSSLSSGLPNIENLNSSITELKAVKSVSMIDISHSSSTPFSILKMTKSKKKKTVRIHNTVELIEDHSNTRKRPQHNNGSSDFNKRKKKIKHKVDPNMNYDNFKTLCGDDKDPLDIILRN